MDRLKPQPASGGKGSRPPRDAFCSNLGKGLEVLMLHGLDGCTRLGGAQAQPRVAQQTNRFDVGQGIAGDELKAGIGDRSQR